MINVYFYISFIYLFITCHSPPHVSVITRKILIAIINKIYPLRSSSYFQQNCHDWFYGRRYNSDNLDEHYCYLVNWIRDLTNRHKLFSIPVDEYASFSHQTRTLKTNLPRLMLNFSTYYIKTGTICLFLFFYLFFNRKNAPKI